MGISAKNGLLLYPILFLIGILSVPLGHLLIEPLSGILMGLQNILSDRGWGYFDLLAASQYFLPFLICSILLALVLYNKEPSLAFALKVFVISFAAISLIVIGWVSFIPLPPIPLLPILFLIIFIIGLIAFKERPLFGFAIRAFALSFSVLLIAIFVWYAMGMSMGSGGVFIYVQEMQIDQTQKIIMLTEEELKEYYLLEKSIEEYLTNKTRLWVQSDEYSEYEKSREFIEKKQREANFLFSIVDTEIENEINKIVAEEDVPEPVKIKLLNAFESRGFTIPENYTIFGGAGLLTIYGEGFFYKIITEAGKLNIYDGNSGDMVFKIGEKYYRFSFGHAD